jgi:hypothetical protein
MDGLVFWTPLFSPDLKGDTFYSMDEYRHLCTNYGSIWTPQGRDFDGVDDYIVTENVIPISGTEARTLEFWVYVITIPVHPHLIGWGDQTGVNTMWKAIINAPTAGSGTWYLWGRGTGNDWDTGVAVETSIWQHHIITYDGTKAEWFINGISLGTFTHAYATTATTLEMGLGTIEGNPSNVIIGEVRIYNRALTPEEIQHNYSVSMPRREPRLAPLRSSGVVR